MDMEANEEQVVKRRRKEEKVLINRTVRHTSLPQERHAQKEEEGAYMFVIGADPQFGIRYANKDWDVEMEYSEKAVAYLNNMEKKPAFVSICGDLVDMEPMMYTGKFGTEKECLAIQEKQYEDFERIYSQLDPAIPLLCLCGNHDVGNRPTPESIERFTSRFGDDYYAFWCRHSYHICLNTNLHNDPSGAPEQYDAQQKWLKERLEYAREEKAHRIFLFGHHPWFLYNDKEELDELTGENTLPYRDKNETVPDKYFSIRRSIRSEVLDLCKEFKVNACFAGHYHQNNISYTSWGMPMIVTGGLCNYNLLSDAKDLTRPENQTPGAGLRIVEVSEEVSTSEKEKATNCESTHFVGFSHHYEEL